MPNPKMSYLPIFTDFTAELHLVLKSHTYYLRQKKYPFGVCGKMLVEGQRGGRDVELWQRGNPAGRRRSRPVHDAGTQRDCELFPRVSPQHRKCCSCPGIQHGHPSMKLQHKRTGFICLHLKSTKSRQARKGFKLLLRPCLSTAWRHLYRLNVVSFH